MIWDIDEKLYLLMEKVRDEWLERAFSPSSFDRDSVREFFKWLYLLNGSKAEVAIFKSPLACQIAANILDKGKQSNLDSDVSSKVYDPLDAQMWKNVKFEVEREINLKLKGRLDTLIDSRVYGQIRRQVTSQVRSGQWKTLSFHAWNEVDLELENQIGTRFQRRVTDQLEILMGSKNLRYVSFAYHGDIGSYPWVAYYDFFSRLGAVESEVFSTYLEYMKNNIFASVQLKGVALASRPPVFVQRNETGRLHCMDGPAIVFDDGYSQHYVEGVYFEALLFEKTFLERNLTVQEFMQTRNAEQRGIILGHFGYDWVMPGLKKYKVLGVLEKRSQVTGEMTTCRLIELDLEGLDLRVLELEDHTTHKKTFLGVPRNAETDTVWKALRWSFPTEKSYYPDIES